MERALRVVEHQVGDAPVVLSVVPSVVPNQDYPWRVMFDLEHTLLILYQIAHTNTTILVIPQPITQKYVPIRAFHGHFVKSTRITH